jgi:hypothetical protein
MEPRDYQAAASATPPSPPGSPSNGYPTNGSALTGIPSTDLGDFWFYKIGEELRNVIAAAGIAPSDARLNQVYTAIATSIQNCLFTTSQAGGTSDAITASYSPAITALSAGMTLYARAGSANATTSPTFTPNAVLVGGVPTIPPATIVKGAGSALVPGDIAGAGHRLCFQWDTILSKWGGCPEFCVNGI